jgi:hypothetical protein
MAGSRVDNGRWGHREAGKQSTCAEVNRRAGAIEILASSRIEPIDQRTVSQAVDFGTPLRALIIPC